MKNTKQKLIILFLLVSCYMVEAQTYITWNEVEQARFGKEVIYKKVKDKTLLSGKYKIATTSGSYSDISFVNGKIDGVRSDYDSSERKEAEATFKNGVVDGMVVNFHQNGKVSTEEFYKNGIEDGAWKRYNYEGRLIENSNYKDGKKEGKWMQEVSVPQEGITRVEIMNYKSDLPIGHWEAKTTDGVLVWEEDYKAPKDYTRKEYYSNGKMEKLETYADGKLDGPFKYYGKEGNLKVEASYKNGYRVFRKGYHDTGKLAEVMSFEKDKPNGNYEKYTSKGIKVSEGNFKDGRKDGVWKEFDAKKGNLESEVGYKNHRRSGEGKYYNEAKKLAETGNFVNDEKDGLWKYYDLAGDLEKEVEYDRGSIVSEKKYK
ncbi:MAG: toxin-antitoxin system YwqK family antitoxin [Aequorivita sp.]